VPGVVVRMIQSVRDVAPVTSRSRGSAPAPGPPGRSLPAARNQRTQCRGAASHQGATRVPTSGYAGSCPAPEAGTHCSSSTKPRHAQTAQNERKGSHPRYRMRSIPPKRRDPLRRKCSAASPSLDRARRPLPPLQAMNRRPGVLQPCSKKAYFNLIHETWDTALKIDLHRNEPTQTIGAAVRLID